MIDIVYLGSKNKLSGDIIPIINKYIQENQITSFYDIFCGGGNVVDKINCENLYASDLSPTLIALHKQAQTDFSQIPEDGSREYWDEAYAEYKKLLKQMSDKRTLEDYEKIVSMPLYKIGAIEWYSSFSRGGFPRGYAKTTETRNYFKEARKNHEQQSKIENYKKINFSQRNYKILEIPSNALIFSDSPYKNVKSYSIEPHFDFNFYYKWLREKSKTNPIFITEQEMPSDFNIIWEQEVKRTNNPKTTKKATEKLFFIDNRP